MMKRIFLFLTLLFASFGSVFASEQTEEKFDAGKLIMEHLGDSYYWHIFTYGEFDASIPLPIILINEGKIDVFMSSKFHHGHSAYKGYKIATEADGEGLEGSIICVDDNGVYTGKKPLDFSITKNVFAIFIVTGLIIFLVLRGAKMAKRNEGQAPKGLLTVVEYFISFIKNDIALPSIGEHKYRKYLPYLLTAF